MFEIVSISLEAGDVLGSSRILLPENISKLLLNKYYYSDGSPVAERLLVNQNVDDSNSHTATLTNVL